MNIQAFKAVYPNFDLIASPDAFFNTVKKRYPEYYNTGFFNQTAKKAIYIYKVNTNVGSHLGFLACIDIEDYDKGKIKIHENTLAYKEQKSMELILQRKAMIKPILLTYAKQDNINAQLNSLIEGKEPFYDVKFDDSGDVHELWRIREKDEVAALKNVIDEFLKEAYIADGHHRSSVLSHLNEISDNGYNSLDYSRLFCGFFSFDQLNVSEFNRVVDILEEISPTKLMAKLSSKFSIIPIDGPAKPQQKHDITAFINKEWYQLKWKQSILDKYKDEEIVLDTTLLNKEVLYDLLGIDNIRTDDRISYVKGSKGIEGVLKKCHDSPNRIAFNLFPIAIEEFQKISDKNILLPPKSTYFEPRMKNGLIAQVF